jgi:hypothetical protein
MRIIHFRGEIFLLPVLFLLTLFSCDKREEYIPYTYVNFSIDLNINNNLSTPGYSEIFPEPGYGGVIIFCENYDYITPGNSIFHAFDATCTYEVSDTCVLTNEGNSFYGECPCCHSKYEFVTGIPIEGVAVYGLKSYTTYLMGNKVYVKN